MGSFVCDCLEGIGYILDEPFSICCFTNVEIKC